MFNSDSFSTPKRRFFKKKIHEEKLLHTGRKDQYLNTIKTDGVRVQHIISI
jgi:hypothetical protein